jgi:hypothetical protein
VTLEGENLQYLILVANTDDTDLVTDLGVTFDAGVHERDQEE